MTPKPRLPLAALLILGCNPVGAETEPEVIQLSRRCTLMGCQNGVDVRFPEPVIGSGEYRLDLSWPGHSGRCLFEIPRARGKASCNELATLDWRGDLELGGFWLDATPKRLRIVLERRGEVVAETTLEPGYERRTPNGPDCDPACWVANASVVVERQPLPDNHHDEPRSAR